MTEVRFKLGEKSAREMLAALIPTAPWWARPQLEALMDAGIEVRIDKVRRKHTSAQQGYYWLCVNIFAKQCGYTPDEMHSVILSEAFGSKFVSMPSGEQYKMPVHRSSKLNVEQYGELIEALHRCAAFNNCPLPDPEAVQ